ncbi:AsnC family transcriptional regulator [Candidatus Geothermarchaeota archaeon ex4572_27]|nr:MAG: AsnC family transcriptional regulator [Candidatus Geothermarchaeota archaeon ex4572_27]
MLSDDARRSLRDIAKELGLSPATVHNRVKRLMEMGVIKGFSPIIDYSKLGYDLTALILLQADGSHLVEVENEVAKLENTCAVYDITGEFDIAVIARFKSREALNRFIKRLLKIPHVKRTSTSMVLNVVKEDFKLSLDAE